MRQGVFLPPPDLILSVAHTTGVSEPEVWGLAKHTLGTQPGRDAVYARVDLPVRVFSSQRLRTLRDDIPFVRHTSVVDWPRHDDPDQQKEVLKQVCLEISQSVEVKLVVAAQLITRTTAI